MAVEHLKSSHITNATATPLVPTNASVAKGSLKEAVGYIVPAADAEANSTYRFCRVPSNARISQILISAADFTTAGNIHVGLYQTTENGGAVVDADLFASAIDLASLAGAVAGNHDITHESGEYTFAEAEKMLYQVLGLTSDPGIEYDVAATISTTFNGGQPMLIKARYAV